MTFGRKLAGINARPFKGSSKVSNDFLGLKFRALHRTRKKPLQKVKSFGSYVVLDFNILVQSDRKKVAKIN